MNEVQPLSGIRVIDFTQVFAGPFASFQLSLLGADVIKIEDPRGGDILRGYAHGGDGMGGMGGSFIAINSGKKSVALNLKDPDALAIAKRLIADGDVLIENFRAGVLDRLGLSWAACKEINPRLVYVTLSGFGPDGPLKDFPAYDHTMQAMSGMMLLNGEEGADPLKVGFPVIDTFAGYVAGFATLAGLAQRNQTGEGQFIDVAMLDASLVLMTSMVTPYLNAGVEPPRLGNRGYSTSPTSDLFETGNGTLSLGANTQDQYERLCRAIGAEDLVTDPRFSTRKARGENAAALRAALTRILADKPATEWEVIISAERVPAAKVRSVMESCAHPQLASRNLFQSIPMSRSDDRQIRVMNSGFRSDFNGAREPSPMLGEHTAAVLDDLGVSPEVLEALRARGAAR